MLRQCRERNAAGSERITSLKNKQKNKDVFFGKHSPSETLPAASKHPAALGR